MDSQTQTPSSTTPNYPIPKGCHAIPLSDLDLRPDSEIDVAILNPPPLTPSSSQKNAWFYWSTGYESMHPYTKRNIRAWHRRFSKFGWTVRVLDRKAGSPTNVEHFLDTKDPATFPKAFIDGRVGGEFGAQHTSDLVRFPLMLKYGGVYADVGMLQIGNLDAMWKKTIGDPDSRYDVLSYNCGGVNERSLANYFMACGKNNPFFDRCHRMLLELWNADGGKMTTEGMHASPLLSGIPLMGSDSRFSLEQQKELTDYITQGHVITAVMGLVDKEGDWNGPQYVVDHIYGIEYMVGSQLINEYTAWDGHKAFKLMSLPLPKEGEVESEEQKQAREIVEGCLSRSFGFKLAHGIILRFIGETLGSLWRENEGSDDVPGTYGHWLRYGMIHWDQDVLLETQKYTEREPTRVGPLLREA
ncbi:uncharacterized protein PAC_17510 [Phialocephala subalpina]|uniref:Capsule polysaccharide biosynthesis protein n=1 Tax=Phialocephala subalpina TaxID=576137 RepID=A0A1L7XRC4_9HELO|nr:uncharacterized protein PAC_17510 [Phialocephala subalpina]